MIQINDNIWFISFHLNTKWNLHISTEYPTFTKLHKDFPFSPCLIPMTSHPSSSGARAILNLMVQIRTFLYFSNSKWRKQLKKEMSLCFFCTGHVKLIIVYLNVMWIIVHWATILLGSPNNVCHVSSGLQKHDCICGVCISHRLLKHSYVPGTLEWCFPFKCG